jgi:hypothetical protein
MDRACDDFYPGLARALKQTGAPADILDPMDYATVTLPVRSPGEVGELASLARQALMPGKDRVDQALRMRELLQEAAPTSEAAAHTSARQAADLPRARAQASQPAASLPHTPNTRSTVQRDSGAAQRTDYAVQRELRRAEPSLQAAVAQAQDTPATLRPRQMPSIADLAPLKAGLQGDLPPARDGDMLRQVAAEVRALRDDLASLSRVLGFAPRTSPEFRGVLQQFDHLDASVQARAFTEDSERQDYAKGRQELRAENTQEDSQAAAARQLERQLETQQAIRSQQAARIAQRQRQLVRALQRAQRQLASVPPEEVPVGLRDEVIGEIYKARYSIAVFGGANGMGQLSGLAFQMSA